MAEAMSSAEYMRRVTSRTRYKLTPEEAFKEAHALVRMYQHMANGEFQEAFDASKALVNGYSHIYQQLTRRKAGIPINQVSLCEMTMLDSMPLSDLEREAMLKLREEVQFYVGTDDPSSAFNRMNTFIGYLNETEKDPRKFSWAREVADGAGFADVLKEYATCALRKADKR